MPTRRTIALALCAFALAALCVRLGFWQWHRMEDKKAEQAQIERHLAAAPVDIASIAAEGTWNPEKHEWMRVRATGWFDTDHQVTVKFTTRDGKAGADVVTPLHLGQHAVVLVNRGWMPTQNTNERPTNIPPPPTGQVTIEGWLRPDNHADRNAVVPVDGQVRAISSRAIAGDMQQHMLTGYINLQKPTAAGLEPEPEPHIGHYLNFFYALQWWFFAGLSFIGPFWFSRPHPQGKAQASAIRSA
jgi:cytochrome oxidase assembly protein ShyY1